MWSRGRLPRPPKGLPASELLIPWLWDPELQRKGSILPVQAWSEWPPGFLFSGISRATVGRHNRGCCPGLAQRHHGQMQSWLPGLIPATPALLITGAHGSEPHRSSAPSPLLVAKAGDSLCLSNPDSPGDEWRGHPFTHIFLLLQDPSEIKTETFYVYEECLVLDWKTIIFQIMHL